MRLNKITISLLAFLILVAGCGIKKPPVPWETIVPKRIVDLEAVPREERLLLEWTSPKENTDKSVLTDLAEFKILRSEGVLIAGECRGCGEKPKVVHEMKWDSKEEVKEKDVDPLRGSGGEKGLCIPGGFDQSERTSQRAIESGFSLLGLPASIAKDGERGPGG